MAKKTNPIADALDFVKVAQVAQSDMQLYRTHCRIANGFVTAFNGVLTIGHPLDLDITACPNTHNLAKMVRRASGALSITQTNGQNINVSAGKLRANVPCVNLAAIPHSEPDPHQGPISDVIREGFAAVNSLVTGAGDTVVESSCLLRHNTIVSTNRIAMIEYWHGFAFPRNLAIPKEAINAIVRVKIPLVGMGIGERSVTFYYDNGAWIKTQLYDSQWPNLDAVLNNLNAEQAVDLPDNFFEAVEAIEPISTLGFVSSLDGAFHTHVNTNKGASYDVPELPDELSFNATNLLRMKAFANKIQYIETKVGGGYATGFFGERTRGLVLQQVNPNVV